MISFQAKYLKMLFAFMAKGDVRFYLNGICVEPHHEGGAVLVATDGKAMICIRDVTAQCSERKIISINKNAIKFAKEGATCYVDLTANRLKISKESTNSCIDLAANRLGISDQIGELYLQPNGCVINGDFPNYKKVVPDFEKLNDVVSGSVQASLLRLLDSASNMSKGRISTVKFWSVGDEYAPIVVQFSLVPEAFAVLMPVRDNSLNKSALADLGNRFFKKLP